MICTAPCIFLLRFLNAPRTLQKGLFYILALDTSTLPFCTFYKISISFISAVTHLNVPRLLPPSLGQRPKRNLKFGLSNCACTHALLSRTMTGNPTTPETTIHRNTQTPRIRKPPHHPPHVTPPSCPTPSSHRPSRPPQSPTWPPQPKTPVRATTPHSTSTQHSQQRGQ